MNRISRSINVLFTFFPHDYGVYPVRFRIRIFAFIRALVVPGVSILLSVLILESVRFMSNLDHFDVSIPFWFFLVLFSCNLIVANYVLDRFLRFAQSDIIFHFIFLKVKQKLCN